MTEEIKFILANGTGTIEARIWYCLRPAKTLQSVESNCQFINKLTGVLLKVCAWQTSYAVFRQGFKRFAECFVSEITKTHGCTLFLQCCDKLQCNHSSLSSSAYMFTWIFRERHDSPLLVDLLSIMHVTNVFGWPSYSCFTELYNDRQNDIRRIDLAVAAHEQSSFCFRQCQQALRRRAASVLPSRDSVSVLVSSL